MPVRPAFAGSNGAAWTEIAHKLIKPTEVAMMIHTLSFSSCGLIAKAFYKCLGLRIDGKIHSEHNCVFILIVSIARRLAPISL